jgi:hypothetical protein
MGRFVPGPAFYVEALKATEPARRQLSKKVIDGAKATVNDDTGNYAESLRVFDDRRGIGAETTDIFGHGIEYGSINNDPQAPLRTGAMAAGRFEPK